MFSETTPYESNFFDDFSNIMSLIFTGLIVVTITLLVITVVIFFVKRYLNNKYKLINFEKKVFLQIQVPEQSYERAQKESGAKRDDKETIASGEQLFRTLVSYTSNNFDNFFYGKSGISFEIVNIKGKINFWIVADEKTVGSLEKQIIATYPRCLIKRVKEPRTIPDGSYTFCEEYMTQNIQFLPFRTYKNMETEPLNTITNAMAGIGKEDTFVYQLVLVPIKSSWQKTARKIALKIQQGQNPDDVLYPKFDFFKELFKFLKSLAPKEDKKDETKTDERKIDYSGKKQAIQLTPQQSEMVKKIEEKAAHPGFLFNLRIIATSPDLKEPEKMIQAFRPALQIFDIRPFNHLTKSKQNNKKIIENYLFRSLNTKTAKIINTEEVTSLWHLPNHLISNQAINYLTSYKPAVPVNLPTKEGTNIFIGEAKSGNETKEIYMTTEDRFRHMYALGGSGSGKSELMTNIILQDIAVGNGLCVIDPHGETVDNILLRLPDHRLEDVIVFSPSQTEKPLGLNLLQFDERKPAQRTLVIDTIFQIWDKLYDLKSTGGPMFEQYMKNAMKLVMSHPESGNTLLEINKVFEDEDFRSLKLAMCKEKDVVDFWEKQAMQAEGDASLKSMGPYITSKLAAFVQNDFIVPMIGQTKSAIDFRIAMDNKKIILVKLEKGLIGETSGYLLGMVIIGQILLAGMGRNDGLKYNEDGTVSEVLASERPPFFVYIDEMQNFLFDAIPKALEEIRKYKIGFCLAHQFVKQVINKGDERIKDSIMANTGTKFIYRCSPEDAEYLSKEFEPTLTPPDLMNPERFTCNTIMLVNGEKTKPFNLGGKLLSTNISIEKKNLLMELTKEKYGTDLEETKRDIKDRQTKFLF